MTAAGSKGRTQGSTLLDAVAVLAGAWWVQTSNTLLPAYFSCLSLSGGKREPWQGTEALRAAAAVQAEPA